MIGFLVRACAVSVLMLAMAWPSVVAAQVDPVSDLDGAVAAALSTEPGQAAPRISIDPSGDTTIEFAIHNADDDPAATREGALADTLTLLRAVYDSSPSEVVRTVTVLGTFPFKGTKSPSVRPTPVLRAVLSAEHAQNLDWQALRPADVPSVVDAWWLQGAFADVEAQPAAQAAPASETLPSETLPSPLDVAVAHLDETIAALDSGQVGIGRSQFTQFFDAWDDASVDIAQRQPDLYDVLDADLERAERELLHTQPEDVAAASAALTDLRSHLSDAGHGSAGE